jgi:hypothetical protein
MKIKEAGTAAQSRTAESRTIRTALHPRAERMAAGHLMIPAAAVTE